MPYTRPYAAGFVDYPLTTTPINSTALNTMDVGIKTANDQIQTLTTAQRTAISSPTIGQIVWDSDLKELFVYMNATTGNAWQGIGNVIICASTTRPTSPFTGQRIFETDTKRLWTYTGAAFVPDDMVFATEAARDTAITSPTEGMRAYITAPADITVTGDTYAPTPTGVQTIYNGTKWVVVTPLSASTDTAGTLPSSTFQSALTSGGNTPLVKLTTGTSALITVSASIANGSVGNAGALGVDVSGASTIAAVKVVEVHQPVANAAYFYSMSRTYAIIGLTAGINTFTLQYSGNTGVIFRYRSLTVQGIA